MNTHTYACSLSSWIISALLSLHPPPSPFLTLSFVYLSCSQSFCSSIHIYGQGFVKLLSFFKTYVCHHKKDKGIYFLLSTIERIELNAFPIQVMMMLYQLCSPRELFMNTRTVVG